MPSLAPISRAAQRAQTRLRILAAARDEFERSGYEAATLREIARRARVAVGTLFVHFEDKRDLLHAALFTDLEAVMIQTLGAVPRRATLLKQLTHVAGGLFDYYGARPELSRTLLRESMFAEGPWSAKFQAQVGNAFEEIVLRCDRAKARGELSEAATPRTIAGAFVAFYYFALIAWVQRALPEPDGHRAMFASLLESHLRPYVTSTRAQRDKPPTPRKRK